MSIQSVTMPTEQDPADIPTLAVLAQDIRNKHEWYLNLPEMTVLITGFAEISLEVDSIFSLNIHSTTFFLQEHLEIQAIFIHSFSPNASFPKYFPNIMLVFSTQQSCSLFFSMDIVYFTKADLEHSHQFPFRIQTLKSSAFIRMECLGYLTDFLRKG